MLANQIAVEALENRTLFAASVFDSAVRIDRLHVQIDLVKFRLDALSGSLTLLSDRIALRGDDVAAATTVPPLIATLHTDVKAMQVALRADRLTEATNALADETVILGELKQIKLDRLNPTALAADKIQLTADRVKLQTDLIAGLNTRIQTRQMYHDTLFNDGAAIVAAVNTDPNASAKLKTDVQTWIGDADTKLGVMAADLATLVAARTQLSNDLTASEA